MSRRKTFSATSFDVPPVLVAGLMLLLLAIFVPLVALTPDLPSALPPVGFNAREVLLAHIHAPRAPTSAPGVDEAFRDAARAAARRDGRALSRAQHALAAFVHTATHDAPAARAALRERHLAEFLAALDAGAPHPLREVAARHGLLATPASGPASPRARAMLCAWFALRWEVGAAPELLSGQAPALPALLARLDPPDRAAMLAWFLGASCGELLGALPASGPSPPDSHAPDSQPATVAELSRCRDLRHDFVALARTELPEGYPSAEADAVVDVLYARGLRRLAARANDPVARGTLEEQAREAFTRANGQYRELAAASAPGGPDARLRLRYLLGTSQGMAE